MEEIETKILEINPAKIRTTLKKNKARFLKKVFQQNYIYSNEYTAKKGITVRIRKEDKDVTLTTKSKVQIINGHKIRHETNIIVQDFKTSETLVKNLGLSLSGITEVKREYWKFHNCSVEICNIPQIPSFIEIEGTPKNISKVVKALGYSKKDYFAGYAPVHYGIKDTFLVFKK